MKKAFHSLLWVIVFAAASSGLAGESAYPSPGENPQTEKLFAEAAKQMGKDGADALLWYDSQKGAVVMRSCKDEPATWATCPADKLSTECSRITETKIQATYYYFAWAQADCATCPLKDQCLSKKKSQPFRTLQVGEKHMIVQERRNLCKTPEYQLRMRRRRGIEGTHSELTRGYRLRRSRYRGLGKTDIQMQFTAAACNLRRWAVRLCWLRRQEAMKAA